VTNPLGWSSTSIENLCKTIFDGPFGSNLKSADYSESGVRVVRLENIGHLEFREELRTFIPRAKYLGLAKHALLEDDIVFSSFVDENVRVCLIPKALGVAINKADCFCLRINREKALPRFVAYHLATADTYADIREMVRGVTRPRINISHLKKYEIRVPPIGKQLRIVEKLDSAMGLIKNCRARLDRVSQILRKFREAVLEAAVSGRLTQEWRKGELKWERVTIGDLLREKPRNGYSPRAVEYATPLKSLTLTATTSGRFDSRHFKYIDESIDPDSHLWLVPGDILVQRANTLEYVGTSAVFDGAPKSFIYPDLMMKCRANDRVSTEYLHLALTSAEVRSFFRAHATGTAGNMPKINQQTVISAPTVLPSKSEQTEVVRRVQELYGLADRFERQYAAAAAHVGKLVPAVLAQAFRGALVTQDPNDEPASVWLEGIRKGRETAESTPKRARVRATGRAKLDTVKAEGRSGGPRKVQRVAARTALVPGRSVSRK
jgi:type I restriction enzyme S subunit